MEELGPGTSGRLSKGQRVVSADWGNASWQQYVAVKEEFLVSATSRLRRSSSPCIFERKRLSRPLPPNSRIQDDRHAHIPWCACTPLATYHGTSSLPCWVMQAQSMIAQGDCSWVHGTTI